MSRRPRSCTRHALRCCVRRMSGCRNFEVSRIGCLLTSRVWKSRGRQPGRCVKPRWKMRNPARCSSLRCARSTVATGRGCSLCSRSARVRTVVAPDCSRRFGWTPREMLRAVVVQLFGSASPFRAPGRAGQPAPSIVSIRISVHYVFSKTPIRLCAHAPIGRRASWAGATSFRGLGAAVHAEEADCQFWAAWAAVLLGDRRDALETLARFAAVPNSFRDRALPLALQAMSIATGHGVLRSIAQDPAQIRTVIRGSGWVGDPSYVPWLIGCMRQDGLARIAGDAVALIPG